QDSTSQSSQLQQDLASQQKQQQNPATQSPQPHQDTASQQKPHQNSASHSPQLLQNSANKSKKQRRSTSQQKPHQDSASQQKPHQDSASQQKPHQDSASQQKRHQDSASFSPEQHESAKRARNKSRSVKRKGSKQSRCESADSFEAGSSHQAAAKGTSSAVDFVVSISTPANCSEMSISNIFEHTYRQQWSCHGDVRCKKWLPQPVHTLAFALPMTMLQKQGSSEFQISVYKGFETVYVTAAILQVEPTQLMRQDHLH
uniref:SKICH domain-containing protein n=1 Tax=Macrostomum lignano TaxID=282301 RepID=A0A1I8HLP1_9PLAT